MQALGLLLLIRGHIPLSIVIEKGSRASLIDNGGSIIIIFIVQRFGMFCERSATIENIQCKAGWREL